MSPVQGESPLEQVKERYGNFDMVTCRLSSCNPECTKYTCRLYLKEGLAVYRERKERSGMDRNAQEWASITGMDIKINLFYSTKFIILP